jgi:hypothetical protein
LYFTNTRLMIDVNLVFIKYKIDPNLCLEDTKSIFQIYFNRETFSKITLKYTLFYKNGPTYVPPTVNGGMVPPRFLGRWILLKKSKRFRPLDEERIPVATGLAFSFVFSFFFSPSLFSLSRSSFPKPNPKTHISFLFSFFFSLPRLSRSTHQASSSSSF